MPDEAYTEAIPQEIEEMQTLAESAAPAVPITVDPELDTTSTNPVQNQAIANEFAAVNQRLDEIEPRKLASAADLNDGGIIRYNTGAINIGSSASSYSSAIDISGCSQIVYTRPILATASAPSSGMAFYSDAAGTQLVGSMIRNGNDASATASRAELYTATVPEGAVTARFTYFISHIDGNPNAAYYKFPFSVYDKAEFDAAYSASVVGRMDALEQEFNEWTVPEATADTLGGVKVTQTNPVVTDSNGRLSVNPYNMDWPIMAVCFTAAMFENGEGIETLIDNGVNSIEDVQSLFEDKNMSIIDYNADAFIFVLARMCELTVLDENYDASVRTFNPGVFYVMKMENNVMTIGEYSGDLLRGLIVNGI